MNVLITSAGQRVSLVRAFKKELSGLYPNSKVYTVDFNPFFAPACQVSDGFKSISRVSDENYIQDLLAICKEWDIKIIIPTIDTELLILSNSKNLFIEQGIFPIVSDLDFVKKCRDKRIMNEFFTNHNIDIPNPISKEEPSFPLFIKPYDGSLSKDIFLINAAEELTDYHFSNEKLMFMEYIDPKYYDEYTIDAYYDKKHQLKCAVPRKRIAVRSGEISKGLTSKNYLVSFLKERLSQLEGALGCLTIQVFHNKATNRVIGIEINPRFGGGYPLSYLAGANFPKWILIEYLENKSISCFDAWEENLLMLRYDDEVLVRNFKE